jgi:2',3'-cyclic-nucleotide 2'-phosphodiesterase (5'-nucleotidase family)
VTNGNVLDALPFVNTLVVCEMTGAEIREVLEQGLTLERGLIQVSGLRGTYDLKRPVRQRLIELRIGDQPVDDQRTYRVSTSSFLAEGGDLYKTFLRTRQSDTKKSLSDVVMEYFQKHGEIQPPRLGRLIQVRPARQN